MGKSTKQSHRECSESPDGIRSSEAHDQPHAYFQPKLVTEDHCQCCQGGETRCAGGLRAGDLLPRQAEICFPENQSGKQTPRPLALCLPHPLRCSFSHWWRRRTTGFMAISKSISRKSASAELLSAAPQTSGDTSRGRRSLCQREGLICSICQLLRHKYTQHGAGRDAHNWPPRTQAQLPPVSSQVLQHLPAFY